MSQAQERSVVENRTPADVGKADEPRRPFVPPLIEEAGRLADVTLATFAPPPP